MKVKVELYTAGTVHHEIVIATDYESAKRTAKARNPEARIISCTAGF